MSVEIDWLSLGELGKAQLAKVKAYAEANELLSITKASPYWYGIDHQNNMVVIPHDVYKPEFPG